MATADRGTVGAGARARRSALAACAGLLVAGALAPLAGASSTPTRAPRFERRLSLPPVVGQLVAVACATPTRCVAVGDSASEGPAGVGSGMVLRSTDGGQTWAPEPLPPGTGPLTAVTCPTPSRCFAVEGFGGFGAADADVVESVDGGVRWHPQASSGLGEVFGLSTIQCASARACVVGGDDFDGGVVATTTDGGQAWSNVSPFSAETETSVSGVWCQGTVCEAVGTTYDDNGNPVAAAARTVDGGVTWTSQTVPAPIDQVLGLWCANATTCEAPAEGPGGGAMLSTTDGGATWTATTLPDDAVADGITCTSARACVATGSVGARGVVLVTTDGAARWRLERADREVRGIYDAACASVQRCVLVGESQRRTALLLERYGPRIRPVGLASSQGVLSVAAVDCAAPGRCAAVGSSLFGAREVAVALTTSDGGRRWAASPLLGSTEAVDVDCPLAARCLAVGVARGFGGVVYAGAAAAGRWRAIEHTKLPLFALSCASATRCVAGGVDLLLSTTDGGRRWRSVRPSGASWVVTSVSCTTGSLCVASVLTRAGRVLLVRSVDGGQRWGAVASSRAISIDAVSCASSRLCVASGGDMGGVGIVILTFAEAMGARWFPHVDRGRLVAALSGGDGAVVLVSNDRAARFHEGVVPATATELVAASCLTSARCLAVGTDLTSPMLLRTTDHGATWRYAEAPRGTTSLTGVACGGGTCVVAGTTALGDTVLATGTP